MQHINNAIINNQLYNAYENLRNNPNLYTLLNTFGPNDHKSPLYLSILYYETDPLVYYDFICYIIRCGANVNIGDISTGDTPLILACKFQLVEIVDLLLESGADPNLPSKKKILPLRYAVVISGPVICKLLVKYGAIITDDIIKNSVDRKIKEYLKNIKKMIIMIDSNKNKNTTLNKDIIRNLKDYLY